MLLITDTIVIGLIRQYSTVSVNVGCHAEITLVGLLHGYTTQAQAKNVANCRCFQLQARLSDNKITFTFTFMHLADTFIQDRKSVV